MNSLAAADQPLTLQEVADRLRVSPRTVQRYVRCNQLVQMDMGHKTKRFRPVDVARFEARLAGDLPSGSFC